MSREAAVGSAYWSVGEVSGLHAGALLPTQTKQKKAFSEISRKAKNSESIVIFLVQLATVLTKTVIEKLCNVVVREQHY